MGIACRSGLRDWLHAPGSLSRRLARLGHRFEVTVLFQGVAPLRARERQALGQPTRGLVIVREVLLSVDGQPLVWARSAVHQSATRGPWKALRGLGSRPLAHLLYDDPRIHRSPLKVHRLARHGVTRRQLESQWREATGCEPPAQMLWSRSSTFHRLGTYLRVMEVFSPLINSRRVQKSD